MYLRWYSVIVFVIFHLFPIIGFGEAVSIRIWTMMLFQALLKIGWWFAVGNYALVSGTCWEAPLRSGLQYLGQARIRLLLDFSWLVKHVRSTYFIYFMKWSTSFIICFGCVHLLIPRLLYTGLCIMGFIVCFKRHRYF